MVTVITRPQGHKIIDQAIAAMITEQYGGDAIVNFPYHGLGTGDFVYITSDIDEYNGFWYVTAADVNSFKISEGATTDFVEYFQDAEIEYYQTQEHDWSSIFLPIVYKCSNDRWPVNSIDTARTVSSFSDDNSFTNLNLSGTLKSSFNALEFVKISGATDDDLNGVWQIVEVISTSDITINLPYSASNSFAGATVQYYHNNYQVKIKIFAGLPTDHPWYLKKPYEEVAELSLTPDDNNEVMFSVSDYIKIKVAIKNNLTLFSLPLNLDAFTGFYISLAESYDDSDNYSLTTLESFFTDDSFEGYAIAGKLPFKNLYAGDYADYVYTSGSPALWLTNHERLVAVEDYYFDISFIKNVLGPFSLIIDKYAANYLMTTETILHNDQGIGVYRLPIVPDANYDSFCVRVRTEEHEEEVPPEEVDLSEMFNGSSGGFDWTLGEFPFVVVPGAFNSEFLALNKSVLNGQTLKVNYNLTVDAPGATSVGIYFILSSDTMSLGDNQLVLFAVSGVFSGSVSILTTADRIYFGILAGNGGTTPTVTINSISFGDPSTITVPGETITEEICIDILETCESINQFTQEARRLLEDGGYRLLE